MHLHCSVGAIQNKVYLAAIHLEYLKRGLQEHTDDKLLQLLCIGITHSQRTTSWTCLPITVNVLQTLKTQLRNDASYSLVEEHLLWSTFTLAFYGFLRVSGFTSSNLQWSNIHLSPATVTIYLPQSKTDPFRQGHGITIQATSTSTCPVRAINSFDNYTSFRSPIPWRSLYTTILWAAYKYPVPSPPSGWLSATVI